jgi:hypothetical protein
MGTEYYTTGVGNKEERGTPNKKTQRGMEANEEGGK